MSPFDRRCAYMMTGLLLGTAPAWGADKVEHWTATSTSSLSITGNVVFSPDKITFQNGTSLSLALVGQVANYIVDTGVSKVATIYRVTSSAEPLLLQSNRLCGGGARYTRVTYIAVWDPEKLPADNDPRAMDVYTGKEPPHSNDDPTGCTGYSYDANFQ